MDGLNAYMQSIYAASAGAQYQKANAAAAGNAGRAESGAAARKDAGTEKESAADIYGTLTEGAGAKKEIRGAGTYGNPRLSREAEDYYNKLTQKYGNLNFVLVASDRKQEAEAMKSSFATPGKMTVLIDTDKIERMAADPKYREQIESTIRSAAYGMTQMSNTVGTKASVKAYGVNVGKDGRASFFAAVDKSFADQRKLIEKRAAKKKEDAKAAKKKAAKEEAAERLEKRRADRKEQKDEVIITANSVEELLRKIEEYEMGYLSDHTQTDEERMIGQSVDYSV